MNFNLELNKRTTAELVAIFQSSSESQDNRSSAFILLCTRFRKKLLEKCEIVCKRFGHNSIIAEQIAENTFKKYAAKPNYLHSASNAHNIDDGFLLYLLGIAEKELTNFYRTLKRRQDGYDYDGTERVITKLPPIPEDRLDLKTRIKHAAIQSLSEKQRTVYLTYEVHKRKGFNLPKRLQAELREHLGIENQARIRGLKKEALDRIDAYIEAMNITKNQSNGTT